MRCPLSSFLAALLLPSLAWANPKEVASSASRPDAPRLDSLCEPRPAPSFDPALAARAAARHREAWWLQYDRSRSVMIAERYEEAAGLFQELYCSAPDAELRQLAMELQMIAQALAGQHQALLPDKRRTSDELSLLYTTAFVYGFGSSAWLALQTKPQSFAGAVLPFALLTTASVGGVAVADGYRPFPMGAPHAIVAGTQIGFLQGVWLVGLQHASVSQDDDDARWNSSEVSTVVWTGASVGAVIGTTVGFAAEPAPGHSSFISSAALWTGAVSGLFAASLESDIERRGQLAFGVAGAGLNLGLGSGILLARRADPSVARVRFVDLGGFGGSLLGAGAYTVLARSSANVQTGYAAAAIGAASGLGLVWWLTADMPKGSAPPALKKPIDNIAGSLVPTVQPVPQGIVVGLAGAL
jgi:hypothetical protein